MNSVEVVKQNFATPATQTIRRFKHKEAPGDEPDMTTKPDDDNKETSEK